MLGKTLAQCRMCRGGDLYLFLDLGFAPPSDSLLAPEHMNEPETFFPLRVVQCRTCGLTQLDHVVDPTHMYGEKYLYESSITRTGQEHFFSMAKDIAAAFNLGANDLAVDIGSNVGVLLEGFKRCGLRVLGIDPAPRICARANERGIETWPELMTQEVAAKIVAAKGQAKVVTATNVFAHIDQKDGLMAVINQLLTPDGIFVIEAPYLVDLIDNLEYDTIYLEHLEYLSVKPLVQFFARHNLELFHVERYGIHGKSIRVFVGRPGQYPVSASVQTLIQLETDKKIYDRNSLDQFAAKVLNHKMTLTELLVSLKAQGKKIVGISAPAKGNTILNYCHFDSALISCIAEKSDIKPGRFTPGMHIPIISEDQLKAEQADYGIIFAWNFAEEIMRNVSWFIEQGGQFIIPIPDIRIVSGPRNHIQFSPNNKQTVC